MSSSATGHRRSNPGCQVVVRPAEDVILKCRCRKHRVLKTFWGWLDKQLPDGQTYVTTPSSALLFPSLCAPTDPLDMPQPSDDGRCGDWAAMMPKRRRTRAQNRAHRVTAERRQNRDARIARREAREAFYTDLLNPGHGDGEPPPF